MILDMQHHLQRYLGLYEREIQSAYLKYAPHCKSFVDIGANDGFYTIVFLRSEAERIVACEPSSEIEKLLNARTKYFGAKIAAAMPLPQTPQKVG